MRSDDVPPARSWVRPLVVAAGGLAVVLFLLLVPLPRSWQGGWQGKLLDLGHVPLFAALTLCLWAAFRGPWYWPAAVGVVVAGLGEIGQLLLPARMGRTADVPDFLRGAAGALAAGLVIRAWQGPRTRPRLLAHAAAVLLLVAWPVAEVTPWLLDAWEGYRAFPTLCAFDAGGPSRRWQCEQAMLTCVSDPTSATGWAGRLEFLPGADEYPSAALEQVVRDWRGYRRLRWSLVVEGGPLTVVFSVRDGPDARGRTSHFQVEQDYTAGAHEGGVDLAPAAARARERVVDLSNVRWVQVFVYRPKSPRVIRLHRIWLE